jgi:vacuolar-type H+-ATPase subunit D/Vma8
LLKRRKQLVVDKSSYFIEEIKALEAIEDINYEVNLLESSLIPRTSALD